MILNFNQSITNILNNLTLLQGFEKVYSGFACERELDIEHNCNILTPNLWPSLCVFLVLLMLNRRPRGSLCWVICYILSASSLDPKLHRGSRGPPRSSVADLSKQNPPKNISYSIKTPNSKKKKLELILLQLLVNLE